MLNKAKQLEGYTLESLDGEIGEVREFYFDDQHWTIRYLVTNTGNWLMGRLVLISPYALVAVHKEKQAIVVNLTKKQIEDSPRLDSDKPVSRQFEQDYHGHFGYPIYWGGPFSWGSYHYPMRDRELWKIPSQSEKVWDPHLRSTRAVSGYYVHATDGEIGHVEDFILDDETWAIRYIIINTSNWSVGRKVVVSPIWIENVSWDNKTVNINLSRESIKQSPKYADESLLTREYEIALHTHYRRKGYWVDELAAKGKKI